MRCVSVCVCNVSLPEVETCEHVHLRVSLPEDGMSVCVCVCASLPDTHNLELNSSWNDTEKVQVREARMTCMHVYFCVGNTHQEPKKGSEKENTVRTLLECAHRDTHLRHRRVLGHARSSTVWRLE